jgi:hypothetical protein
MTPNRTRPSGIALAPGDNVDVKLGYKIAQHADIDFGRVQCLV